MSSESGKVSKAAKVTGWVLTILPVLMFMLGPVMLLTKRADMVKDMGKHGYAERVVVPLIIVQVVCALLYVIPQTDGKLFWRAKRLMGGGFYSMAGRVAKRM